MPVPKEKKITSDIHSVQIATHKSILSADTFSQKTLKIILAIYY